MRPTEQEMRTAWLAQARAMNAAALEEMAPVAIPQPPRGKRTTGKAPQGPARPASNWKWSAIEEMNLRAYTARGLSVKQIALLMSRTPWIIEQKAQALAKRLMAEASPDETPDSARPPLARTPRCRPGTSLPLGAPGQLSWSSRE